MTPDSVASLFTRRDGTYLFARWGRPIVPVVFGVDDATLAVVKGAIEAVVTLAGHRMAETDPELGANLMLFFFRDWAELTQLDGLHQMVPDLAALCQRLEGEGANQYRLFRFDPDGTIKAVFSFVRMDAALTVLAAEDLALCQAVEMMCTWSDSAFADTTPLTRRDGLVILRPDIAGVIRAGYDPVMPAAAQDASHALRLYARLKPRDLS
ncbi:MAG: hypothetical protein ABI832_08290 [bacterium]